MEISGLGELLRSSDGPALADVEGRVLSYRALVELTRRVEKNLRDGGIGPGERVALVVANGPVAATSFFALAASCAVAPLNPAYTAAEFAFYLRDLEVRLVVVEEGVSAAALEAARELGVTVAMLRGRADEVGGFELELPAAPGGAATGSTGPSSMALLLHTSGTTSRPKLVGLTQANLAVSARQIARTLGLGERDVCLNLMPLFHVHGLVACVLATWSSGGTVVASPGFSAVAFEGWLERNEPTWISAVPTMYQGMLARHPSRPRGTGRLRFLRASSSALPASVGEALEKLFGVPVLQAYGMTEASHQISSNPLPPAARKPGSVGRPVSVEVGILDAEGRPVPQGQRGEVCLKGASIFSGYVANPEANRASFFGEWFRTGDEGYLDEDGYLFLTGRLKEMINKGGEKVAPAEVEDALLAISGVAQAAVFAMPDERLGEEVAAVVVPRPGVHLEAGELRSRVAGQVASFKVPRLVLVREEIPKGPTGKVQRRRLAEQLGVSALMAAQASAAGPSGASEQLAEGLVRLAHEVLERPLALDEDFFAAGGDSLAASRLLDRVALQFGVQVLPVEFFNGPTLSQLASVIEGRAPGAKAPGASA